MPGGKSALIPDDGPDLVVGQYLTESDHGRARGAMLDHPEDLTFRAMAPESVVPEITRRWIQLGSPWPIPASVCSMAIEASALAVIERFAFIDDLRGIGQGAR
jgi:hypothetical protein